MLLASEALQIKIILSGVSNRKRYVGSYIIEIRCHVEYEKVNLKEHIQETGSNTCKKGVVSLLRQTLLKDIYKKIK